MIYEYVVILDDFGRRNFTPTHISISVASWMSHHEQNQTAVSYSNQFLTRQYQIQVWQLLYLSGISELMPDDVIQSSMSEQWWKHVYS